MEMLYHIFNWVFLRYHLGDYGGEILNEVKLNRPEKEMSTTPSTLHNGNHHKVQECKVKVSFLGISFIAPLDIPCRCLHRKSG